MFHGGEGKDAFLFCKRDLDIRDRIRSYLTSVWRNNERMKLIISLPHCYIWFWVYFFYHVFSSATFRHICSFMFFLTKRISHRCKRIFTQHKSSATSCNLSKNHTFSYIVPYLKQFLIELHFHLSTTVPYLKKSHSSLHRLIFTHGGIVVNFIGIFMIKHAPPNPGSWIRHCLYLIRLIKKYIITFWNIFFCTLPCIIIVTMKSFR